MSDQVNNDRRRFLRNSAITIAAAEFAMMSSAYTLPGAQPTKKDSAAGAPSTKPSTNASFGPLKQIDAGVLNVGYAEVGPASGPAAILLHGWPYDIYSFVDVVPVLASAGYRVIVPYLRGYGTTRFLSSETVRNGQPSAIAVDTVALMDALKIQKAIVAGFDWGGRTADIMAALWPERCKGLVSVSGYLIGSQAAGKTPLPRRLSSNGGISFILPRIAAGTATTNTVAILRSSSGSWLRRSGTSMMPRSTAVRRRSTIRITSPS